MPITLNGSTGITYPAGGTDNPAGTGVGTTDTQTLTNKTLTTPTIGTIKSASSGSPPTIQDSAGTEIGTFCRAWVNFNGTGTVAIRSSFNVTSITDNNTGDYTVNFTTAMADANYAYATGSITSTTVNFTNYPAALRGTVGTGASDKTASAVRLIVATTTTGTATDSAEVNLLFFR